LLLADYTRRSMVHLVFPSHLRSVICWKRVALSPVQFASTSVIQAELFTALACGAGSGRGTGGDRVESRPPGLTSQHGGSRSSAGVMRCVFQGHRVRQNPLGPAQDAQGTQDAACIGVTLSGAMASRRDYLLAGAMLYRGLDRTAFGKAGRRRCLGCWDAIRRVLGPLAFRCLQAGDPLNR